MYHPQWNFSPPTPSPAPRDSPAFRVALGNVTQASTNQPPMEFHHYTGPPSRASTSTKRTRDSSSDPPRARHQNQRRKTTEAVSASGMPAIFAVGPPSAPPPPVDQTHFGSLVTEERPTGRTSEASDVWYFVEGVLSNHRPNPLPQNENANSKTRPNQEDFGWLRCRLCPSSWHDKREAEAVQHWEMSQESEPDHDSPTEEKAHPGDHVHPDWDTPLPVPGSLEAQVREKECEILDLTFDMKRQKQRISELEEYVTALEKARDLLPEMRADYNSALDRIAHEQERAERLNRILANNLYRLITAFRAANPADQEEVVGENLRRMKVKFQEEYEKSTTNPSLQPRYDLEAPPEDRPEGRDAWVAPWLQDKYSNWLD
ncbi:hypothetical protein C8J56DRAFT_1049617 [Mycena floridula]|nr:hypothetical protein C8J56DRAFT_1049617 [Mycena floridula]